MAHSKLWTNAKYQIKILTRGWFFRIILGLAIPLLILFNFFVFFKLGRTLNGLSSYPAYANLSLFTILGAVLLIFVSTDLSRRNRVASKVDAFFVRSMTNAEYFLGQIVGLFLTFLGLVVFATLMAIIVNVLLIDEITFNWQPYVYYPFLIWLPCFLYVLGLSNLLMWLIKNQAIVIVLLISYLLLDLIYFSGTVFYLFNFTAFNIPLLYSDFSGIPDIDKILLQRLLYVGMGLVFLFTSVVHFHRLPQSRVTKTILKGCTVLFLCVSVAAGFFYLNFNMNSSIERERYTTITESYAEEYFATINRCVLNVSHQSDKLFAKSELFFTNKNSNNLHIYVFTLNPGLRIDEITHDGKPVAFDRIDHIVLIQPDRKLEPNQSDSLTIKYSGTIDEKICTLNIPVNILQKSFSIFMNKVAKKHAFLNRNYVLLNADCLWYPSTTLPQLQGKNPNKKRDFTAFELDVQTSPRLLAIAQGKRHELGEGLFSFHSDFPLSELSLIIGNYEHHQISTDRCTYHLYHHPKHDYYKPYFSLNSDDLVSVIKELEAECYQILPIDYPYSDYSLIESPIQFTSFKQLGRRSTSRTPPQISLLHEQNILQYSGDFASVRQELNNAFSAKEMQVQLFKNYIQRLCLTPYLSTNAFRYASGYDHRCWIFPQLYSNSLFFASPDTIDFNSSIDSYLNFKIEPIQTAYYPFQNWMWLSEEEQINQALMNNSLDNRDEKMLTDFHKLHGQYYCRAFLLDQNQKEFDSLLFNFINTHQHQFIDVETFTKNIPNLLPENKSMPQFQLDQNNKLPAFTYSDFNLYKIEQNNQTLFQVIFNAANVSDVPGIFEVYFLTKGDRLDWSRESSIEPHRIIHLDKNTHAQIGIVLDLEPTAITLNPMIAQNLPLYFGRHLTPIKKKSMQVFDGVRLLEGEKFSEGATYITDNADKQFKITNKSKPYFEKLFKKNRNHNQYGHSNLHRPPSQWSALKHMDFYGPIQKTAMYIKSGTGENFVTWSTELPSNGNYTLYAYVPAKRIFQRKSGLKIKDFNYTVYHDDGQKNVRLYFDQASEGWNELGQFYLSEGPAKVELSDKSDGLLVLADAVKWEKN